MNTPQSGPRGLWLPLVTPFRDGELDERSVRRLVSHYAGQPVDGLILAGTTGECLTLDEAELEALVAACVAELAKCASEMPLYLGLSGSHTRKLVTALEHYASWPVEGYLVACPYYTRPSQEGLFQHFTALADATDRPILIYNIPYRTGVNIENDTMLRLAGRPNIVGAKDCCADPVQSFDLARSRPGGFTVLTGEDMFYYDALTHGADGAILASAHIETSAFAGIAKLLADGNQPQALRQWQTLSDLPRLLFEQPSVASIKHWLWRSGLIDTPEVRLPIVGVTEDLARRLDAAMDRQWT